MVLRVKTLVLLILLMTCAESWPQDEIFVSGFEPVPELFLDASPEVISLGESTTITWSVIDADSCAKLGDWSGAAAAGTGIHNQTVMPNSLPAIYSMQCSNQFGHSPTRAVVVEEEITSPPTLSLQANPTTIAQGQSVTLNWNANNANACTSSSSPMVPGWSGSKPTAGSFVSVLNSTTTFSMTCSNGFGSVLKNVTVTVNEPVDCVSNQPPVGTFRFAGLTAFDEAMGSIFGDFTSDYASYLQPTDSYAALGFYSPQGVVSGKLLFETPLAQYPAALATSVSVSACLGDFDPDSVTGRCRAEFSGNFGTLRWSTQPSANPLIYCILEPNMSYFLNIIHAPLDDLNSSSCPQVNGCGVLFYQTEN